MVLANIQIRLLKGSLLTKMAILAKIPKIRKLARAVSAIYIRHIHQNRPFLCSSTRVYKGTEQARRVANYNLLDIMAFSTSMDTKKEKNIYAFAKVTKTRILHSLEEVKGLVNGKPDQIYKIFFSLTRQLNSYNSNVLMSTLRKQRQFSQEVRYLKPDKEDLLFHTLVSICKLENVMNAVKSQ